MCAHSIEENLLFAVLKRLISFHWIADIVYCVSSSDTTGVIISTWVAAVLKSYTHVGMAPRSS